MSHLTLTEVLELVQDDDDASEAESEGDELSGADFLGNGGDCDREHELLRIDAREDPCYRSSLLLLDQSLVEVMFQKLPA